MAASWSFSNVPLRLHENSVAMIIQQKPAIMSLDSSLIDDNPSTYAMTYRKLHLLGLPSEVRDAIWQAIFDDIIARNEATEWDKRPRTPYDNLTYTCHQIHDEISFFWPRTIIQHNRILTITQPQASNRRDFKLLTLEIPIGQKYEFFRKAGQCLRDLATVLQNLRLFFIGSDKFHVPLSLDACGVRGPNAALLSERLTIEGQNHAIRQPLFVALLYLFNLRSLVLSNHNYPLLPKFAIENKKRLKYLHIVTDPRTTVHQKHDLSSLTPLMIKPLTHAFPPVEVLNIYANASLNSLQLAAACSLNLKHLTWTVPDCSLQSSGGLSVDWYRATANLLHVLKMNAKVLVSLRICFHEAIYEADDAAAILVPAFNNYLEHFPIEILELHINSQSPWFGREIIQHLPYSLKRLYITRELIDEALLALSIDSRYLACHAASTENPWTTTSNFIKRLDGREAAETISAGEDIRRQDLISLGGGKLGFIGYQYEPRKSTRFGDSKLRLVEAAETRSWMLTLNGRLLDRERNMHTADLPHGTRIRGRISDSSRAPKLATFSIAERYGPMWVYAPASMKERKSASQELAFSFFSDKFDGYFGQEDGAVKTFESEESASPGNMPKRSWPDEVSVDDGDHWMTDDQPGRKKRFDNDEGLESRRHPVLIRWQDSWKAERTAHWVKNWTWYSREKSYINEHERDDFLMERKGPTLDCLTIPAEFDGGE